MLFVVVVHSELSVSLNFNIDPRLLCESDVATVLHIVMVCDRNDVRIVRNAVGKAGELQRLLAIANIDFGIQNVFQSKDFNLIAEITFAGESTHTESPQEISCRVAENLFSLFLIHGFN